MNRKEAIANGKAIVAAAGRRPGPKHHDDTLAIIGNTDIPPCNVPREINRQRVVRQCNERKQLGLTSVQVWVPPDDAAKIRQRARQLRNKAGIRLPND
jgi:hypothetical protein